MVSQALVYASMVGAYLIIILGLAVYIATRWIDDPGDFMLAGREIGSWASGFALLAILMSGGFVPAIVLHGYLYGVGGAWFFWGWTIGQALVFLTYATFWRRSGAYTPAEYFEFGYGVSGRLSVLLASIVAMLMIAAFQFVGAGALVASLMGIDLLTAVVGIGGITIGYTLLSGMWGITISDFIQAIWVMVSVFILIPAYLFVNHGMPSAAAPDITAQMMQWPFGSMAVASFAGGTVISIVWQNWLLANSPYYWVRASATRSEDALRKGYMIAIVFSAFIAVSGAFIGLWAQMLTNPDSADQAFGTLLANEVPVWLGGLAASGVIAATMSTADAIYQGIVNTVVRDYVQRFTSVNDRGRLLLVGRLVVVVAGFLTIVIALSYPGQLGAMIAFAFAFVAPIFVLNFDAWMIRYGTKEAAVITVFVIIPLVTYWEFYSPYIDAVNTLWVAGAVSFVVFYGISALVRVTGPWWADSVDNLGDQLSADIWKQGGD